MALEVHIVTPVREVWAGEVQELTRGGVKSTTFYCHAPGGILVEVSASEA